MNSLYSSLIQDFERRLLQSGIPQRLGLAAVTPVPLDWPLATQLGVAVEVLPLDRLHAVISGNKWFKLKYNLLAAHEAGSTRLVSCGGARSNHLHALAWAGQRLAMSTRAVIRGEEWAAGDNATLRDLTTWGMVLQYVSREQYRQWRQHGWALERSEAEYVIPEGGDNFLGVLGCVSLAAMVDPDRYDAVHVAGGTGCTFLGLRVGLPARVAVVGHSMLKGEWQHAAMRSRLQAWCFGYAPGPWRWLTSVGRFGHSGVALQDFIADFTAQTGLQLDSVYTGPLFLRLSRQLLAGEIATGTRILVVHSGGLQGASRNNLPQARGEEKLKTDIL